MRKQAKCWVAVLVASASICAMGCGSKEVAKPVQSGQMVVSQNGAQVSVVGFDLKQPVFVDSDKVVHRPQEGQAEVAVLTIKVKNTTDKDINYKPLHDSTGVGRVQICSDADLESEADHRVWVEAIKLDDGKRATTQIVSTITLKPGEEITDDYLFEKPTTTEQLVALVPGAIVGQNEKMMFYLDKPKQIQPPAPASLGEAVTIGGVKVKVTKVDTEYAELAQSVPPEKPLKYAYAYTNDPVLAVHINVENASSSDMSYDPAHNAVNPNISLTLAGGAVINRVKFTGAVKGKDQVDGIKTVKPGEAFDDVYYFTLPGSDASFELALGGKIFGVSGLYQFALNYQKSTPEKPDLEPYKNAGKADDKGDEGKTDANDEADSGAVEAGE